MKSKSLKKDPRSLLVSEWYQALISDCKALIVESEFISRWSIVECYHALGERICEENDNFKRSEVYGKDVTSKVAVSLNKSPRTVQKAIQFYKKYPDLDKLPAGKNTSWHQICNKLLPEPSDKEPEPCQHEPITICRKCKERITP